MNMNVTQAELAACPALRGLKPEYIAILAQGAEQQVLAPGELIIRQGQPANRMFLVHEGTVLLEWHRPGQKDTPVHIAGPGEIVGWSWLFPPFVSHFQARVVEPSKVYVLNGGNLLATCEKNCRFGFDLMSHVAKTVIDRLQSARKQVFASTSSNRVPAPAEGGGQRGEFEAHPIKKLLEMHPFLHGMSAEHLQQLSDCAMEVQFEAGQTLFTAGDIANRFYLILAGKVALQSCHNGQTVQTITGGDVLGWSWLYEPYQWHFDARAEAPTRAVFIYGTRLREMCQSDPCFGFDLLKRVTRVVIQRLEKICEQLPA
jgi:CRP/FNR family cyclic AMP-dependent transcriptional regulator